MKKYLVSYVVEYCSGPSFYNKIIECDGNARTILKLITESVGIPAYRTTLINFWEI